MLVAFPEEGVAEGDGVLNPGVFTRGLGVGKPQAHAIEEVKPTGVGHPVATRAVIRAEKHRGRKDSLKALQDSTIMTTVLGEMEKLEHLRGAAETDNAAPLPESECGDPNRDEPILAIGQAKTRMTGDFQGELSIAAYIGELVARRTAKRDTAEYEGPGVVGKFLVSRVTLLADKADRLEAFEVSLGNTDSWDRDGGPTAGRRRQFGLRSDFCN